VGAAEIAAIAAAGMAVGAHARATFRGRRRCSAGSPGRLSSRALRAVIVAVGIAAIVQLVT
jgi:hypothetical protein